MKYWLLLFLLAALAQLNAQTRGAQLVNTGKPGMVSADSTLALVVGVSAYENITPLQFADADAKAFYRYLTSANGANIPVQNVKLLLNKEATRNSVLNNIYSFLAKNATRAKRIIVYFAGHGDADEMGEQYLLAAACNPANDASNYAATDAIAISELKNKLRFFANNHIEVILVMDACRTNKLLKSSQANLLDLATNMEQTTGEMLFLSCGKGEVSQEGSQWGSGRGIFSYYFINGLSGKADRNGDNLISIDEITRYTDSGLYDDANNKATPKQAPVFRYYPLPKDHVLFSYVKAEPELIVASNTPVPSGTAYRTAEKISNTAATDANLSKFFGAIHAKRLLQPENDCAAWYINQMQKAKAKPDLITQAQNTLAIEMLDSCVRIMNLYISGLDNLGNYQYRIGKVFTRGKILFAKSRELLQTINPEIAEVNKAMGLFFEARSVLEIENEQERISQLPGALQAVNQALQLKPKAAYLLHLKALLLNASGKKEEALAAEKEAIEYAPYWIYPYNTLAGIYFSSRKYPEAMEYYQKAAAIDSNSFLPYIGLGNTYKKMGKYRQALENYNKSIAKDSLNTAAYYNRGFYYVQYNEAEKGRRDFEKVLKIDPRFYDAYLGMATYYESKSMYADAMKQYTLAAGIDNAALNELQGSATSLEMLGKTEIARQYKELYNKLKAGN